MALNVTHSTVVSTFHNASLNVNLVNMIITSLLAKPHPDPISNLVVTDIDAAECPILAWGNIYSISAEAHSRD